MRTELRHCADCGNDGPFEVPLCVDGHDGDCPERLCENCGAALLVDPPRRGAPKSGRRHVGHAA